jgi:hypothetical protein
VVQEPLQKKCLFSRVETLEISNKNLRKKLFQRSRWPSKGVDRNTVEKYVSTAFTTLEESILPLSRVITIDKKCWITSHILLVSRVIILEISTFSLYRMVITLDKSNFYYYYYFFKKEFFITKGGTFVFLVHKNS